MFYSKTTKGFYNLEIHGSNMPADCVEVSQQDYDALFAGQVAGKEIVPDANGYPVLADPTVRVLPYGQARALEYPPIGDQLDALFHAGIFPPEMAAKIQAVKNKYPKV